MEKLIDAKVFCKRNGTTGIITGQDAVTITIQTKGEEKTVTHSTFDRWYKITAMPAIEIKPITPRDTEAKGPESPEDLETLGDMSVGLRIRNKFIRHIKMSGAEHLEFFYNPKNKADTVRYNGFNIFECTYSKKAFNIMCHPNSLTPHNKTRVTKMYPKEWGWVLRAKFVFDDLEDSVLMRSIVTDGLYYRKE